MSVEGEESHESHMTTYHAHTPHSYSLVLSPSGINRLTLIPSRAQSRRRRRERALSACFFTRGRNTPARPHPLLDFSTPMASEPTFSLKCENNRRDWLCWMSTSAGGIALRAQTVTAASAKYARLSVGVEQTTPTSLESYGYGR